MIYLDETDIRQHIQFLNPQLQFDIFESIDSTNRFLKNQPSQHHIRICCAETQTQGRGRFGRTWHSPMSENIYFSAKYRFDCALERLSGLSLVTSLAVIETLKELGLSNDLFIKWPNDILWNKRKLSGCLIELAPNKKYVEVIIGIGINVNSNTQTNPIPDKPWCSLWDISGTIHNRNRIIGRLIEHLHQHLQSLISSGLKPFLSHWEKFDALYGQLITVSTPAGQITGRADGIDDTGRLILIDCNQHIHFLSSGETSLSK